MPVSEGADNAGGPGLHAQAGRALAWVRSNPLVPLLTAGAAVIAIVVVLLLWAGGPDYRVLYSNLDDSDGGSIISALEQRGVPYRFAQGGHALLVPADKVYDLRLRLAEQGLPHSGNVGFEIMDKQSFGISQFAEHVNFQRGLQGELASSIEVLQPVAHARVHLALPKDSVFIREQKPAKATVILTLHPGRALSGGQVDAIVHMVSSSVRELTPDNVTVVDQNGHLLSRNGSKTGLDGSQLDYVREVESGYQHRIESILAPILGAGNVHAQVTAQLDFSHREETAEHYTPNQGDHPAAVRSRQATTSWSGDDALKGGIPGALTNMPPGIAASPIDNGDTADGDADASTTDEADDTPSRGDVHRENTTNYEVDRSIVHTRYRQGGIKRLSVAVVVNYRQETQEDGSLKAVPLDDTAMRQITELTRQAMGFSTARGDSLEVVNSAFTEPAQPVVRDAWWQQADWMPALVTWGRYLLVLAALLLLYRLVLRPLLQRLLADAKAHPETPATTTPEAEPDDTPPPRPRRHQASAYEHNLRDLKQRAEEDPAMIAMIVRGWLKQHD